MIWHIIMPYVTTSCVFFPYCLNQVWDCDKTVVRLFSMIIYVVRVGSSTNWIWSYVITKASSFNPAPSVCVESHLGWLLQDLGTFLEWDPLWIIYGCLELLNIKPQYIVTIIFIVVFLPLVRYFVSCTNTEIIRDSKLRMQILSWT